MSNQRKFIYTDLEVFKDLKGSTKQGVLGLVYSSCKSSSNRMYSMTDATAAEMLGCSAAAISKAKQELVKLKYITVAFSSFDRMTQKKQKAFVLGEKYYSMTGEKENKQVPEKNMLLLLNNAFMTDDYLSQVRHALLHSQNFYSLESLYTQIEYQDLSAGELQTIYLICNYYDKIANKGKNLNMLKKISYVNETLVNCEYNSFIFLLQVVDNIFDAIHDDTKMFNQVFNPFLESLNQDDPNTLSIYILTNILTERTLGNALEWVNESLTHYYLAAGAQNIELSIQEYIHRLSNTCKLIELEKYIPSIFSSVINYIEEQT